MTTLDTSAMKFFLVGGAIRDEIMGLPMKDLDFAVEAESFEAMRDELLRQGFTTWQEQPEHLTIRCKVPESLRESFGVKDADFVLCRKEGPYSDGRRPDWVKPGTLMDDLERRDFTVNAIAKDMSTGKIIDPFNGIAAIEAGVLICVGGVEERFTEDALRALRAIRFVVTKGFTLSAGVEDALASDWLIPLIENIPAERIAGEFESMFKTHTLEGLLTFVELVPTELQRAIFQDRLWLQPKTRGT